MSDMRNDFEEMIRQEVESDREYKIALRRVAGDYVHNGMQQRFEDFCCGVESTESRIAQLETELAAYQEREQWIHDNATTNGGGNGFTVTFFVPVDHEDIFCGISAALASQAQQTEKKQLSRQDILKVFYTLKDKDKHFPMIEREISSALGSQLFVYGWLKAVEFDIQPPAPDGGDK